jgi:MoxR-like ATPase
MGRRNPADDRYNTFPQIDFQGVRFRLPHPEKIPPLDFVPRTEILERAMAAWLAGAGTHPLNFRFFGPPGVGKNAIVYQLAKMLKKDLYILNGNEELDPEDISCTARINSSDGIEYVASPLFAAMLKGGIFFFDEIGKAPPGALNPLTSVLDERRTLDSVLAGVRIEAHRDFRCCAALNDDEETGGRLPASIEERLRPAIHVGIPPPEILKKILMRRFCAGDERWIDIYLRDFWSEEASPRDARIHLQYALGMANLNGGSSATDAEIRKFLQMVRGTETKSPVPEVKEPAKAAAREKTDTTEKPDEERPKLVFHGRREGETTH